MLIHFLSYYIGVLKGLAAILPENLRRGLRRSSPARKGVAIWALLPVVSFLWVWCGTLGKKLTESVM